jgi:predicted secreted Zn-dependent protease
MSFNVTWRRSKSCGQGNCVEVAALQDAVAIRDSKNPSQGAQLYTFDEWQAFVAGVKRGDFDDLISAR